ncbi:MAG: hypothetical protein MUC97_17895 [Bernardetiaceae bacterium]|jgi:hypothetical protein|nr:hypothetical protein [Bernardetiaceae bacterium]
MKLWRDLKLLALGTGLLALDGCRPKDDWGSSEGYCFIPGTVVGREQCGDDHYLVLADAGISNCPPELFPKTVPGRYNGRDFPRLVRIYLTPVYDPNGLTSQEGACGWYSCNLKMPDPSCASDSLSTYRLFEAFLMPEAPFCLSGIDRR